RVRAPAPPSKVRAPPPPTDPPAQTEGPSGEPPVDSPAQAEVPPAEPPLDPLAEPVDPFATTGIREIPKDNPLETGPMWEPKEEVIPSEVDPFGKTQIRQLPDNVPLDPVEAPHGSGIPAAQRPEGFTPPSGVDEDMPTQPDFNDDPTLPDEVLYEDTQVMNIPEDLPTMDDMPQMHPAVDDMPTLPTEPVP